MFSWLLKPAAYALPVAALAMGLTTAAHARTGQSYWQGVQKAGVLRCGAAVAPPYVMQDPTTNKYSGVYVDLCRQFAQVLGVKAEFVNTTWDNIVAGLQAGKWDLSLALNRTPERAMAVNFSIAPMKEQVSLVYRKDDSKIPPHPVSVADTDKPDITLAVMSGTVQDKAISAAIKHAQILRLPTEDAARLAVISHRADINVDAADTNLLFTEVHKNFTTLDPTPSLISQGIAFGLPDQLSYADVSVFNIFLQDEMATGEVDKLIHTAVDQIVNAGH